MKLSTKQLRKIISEELKRVSEARMSDFDKIEAMTNTFREILRREWPFDPGDQSMAFHGEEAWNDQKEAAVEDFMNEVSELIEKIENKLIGGEYHYDQTY